MKALNIVIIGVGGQGTLLTSRILGHMAQAAGLDVKVSEVHGMAQRGGSVITHVRMSEKVYAPLVSPGEADYVLAFEQLEAVRAIPYVKKGGTLIAGMQRILPMPVITGAAEYPADVAERLASLNVEALDALALAVRAGSFRAVNIVLIGVLARHMDLPKAAWQEAIRACVPAKTLETNLRAFELGYEGGARA